MKVSIVGEKISPEVIEDFGVLDILEGDDKLSLLVGLSEKIPMLNNWEYDDNDMMADLFWDMGVQIGQGNYVSPNVGAQFANFVPCDIIQKKTAPLKPATGSLNHLLIDTEMKDPILVDPGKGVINALKDAGKVDAIIAYTNSEFPKDEILDTLKWAKEDGVRVNFLPGGDLLSTIVHDGYQTVVPYHNGLLTHDLDLFGESTVYLGSNGQAVARVPRSRGYEVNPYHVAAHRYIDNATEEHPGSVVYSLRSGGRMKRFTLFPYMYRYLPQQLHRYHHLVKAKDRQI